MKDNVVATQLRERFLTRRQAAEMLGLKATTLAVWQSQKPENAPPMRKHGSRAMYAERDLIRWSEERRV
jgi:hypothetical protein